jgi:DNA polymerase I-like protein with 3'-5' exonuclease and polymerase domains
MLQHYVAYVNRSPCLAIDLETTGLDYVLDRVVGVAFADDKGEYYADLDMLAANGCLPAEAWWMLKPLFDMERHLIFMHNAPFDLYFARKAYLFYHNKDFHWEQHNSVWDTMAMTVLLDENQIGARIEMPNFLGKGSHKVGALSLKGQSWLQFGRTPRTYDEDFMQWAPEERAAYACDDARNTFDLGVLLGERIKTEGLLPYWEQFVAPVCYPTEVMERLGIAVDTEKVAAYGVELDERIAALDATIQELVPPQEEYTYLLRNWPGKRAELVQLFDEAGVTFPLTATGKPSMTSTTLAEAAAQHPKLAVWKQLRTTTLVPFNPDSDVMLAEYLAKHRVTLPTTDKGNPSVKEEVLLQLAEKYPKVQLFAPLLERRKLMKLKNTYVQGILDCVWEDGRVHGNWNSTGTVTGRFSCTKSSTPVEHPRGPALQTIPRPDTAEEMGCNPREWFVAAPGYKLIVADLSQAEIRMLAALSKDAALKDAILSGVDLHTANAQRIYSKQWEEADDAGRKVLRNAAKATSFGTVYGIGANGLARRIGCTKEEAQAHIDAFYHTFMGVERWMNYVRQVAQRREYSETYYGRRRRPVFLRRNPAIDKRQQALYDIEQDNEFSRSFGKFGREYGQVPLKELESRALRQAVNASIQGGIGEIINRGLVEIVRAGYRLLLQMHDEVVIEVRDDEEEINKAVAFLKGVYEITLNDIPFVLDVHVGNSWGAGKE